MHDAIYAIEWRPKGSAIPWRHWSIRFTEKAARKWIEREIEKHKNMEFRVAEFARLLD